jgi:hypothetical protein
MAIENIEAVAGVSHVIQLAVAPVFLLTGVGAILSVLINRLARIVDRFRQLEKHDISDGEARRSVDAEMGALSMRATFIHWAIGLCTGSALFVCMVVAMLFLGSILRVDLSTTISVLFVLAMTLLVIGLLGFLREITIARSSIHRTPR